MDNRIAGLLIIVAALLFLWLYDTGRWGGIVSVVKGQVPAASTGGLTLGVPAIGTTQQAQQGGSGAGQGSLIGGAIGSIVPGIGSVIGGALGGIFGGLFH